MGAKFEDLTGRKIGFLRVLGPSETKTDQHRQWLCECSCGRRTSVRTNSLKTQTVRSCGCTTSVVISWQGQSGTMAEWAKRIGLAQTGIIARLRLGWSLTDAITTPAGPVGVHSDRRSRTNVKE
jgi:hypothetical protein